MIFLDFCVQKEADVPVWNSVVVQLSSVRLVKYLDQHKQNNVRSGKLKAKKIMNIERYYAS